MTTSFTRRIASPPDSCFHDYYLRRCNIRSAVQCFVSSTSTKQLESLSSPAWSASRLSSVRPVLHSLRDRDRNRLGYPSAPVLGINRKFLLLIPIFTSVNPCAASDVRPSNQSIVRDLISASSDPLFGSPLIRGTFISTLVHTFFTQHHSETPSRFLFEAFILYDSMCSDRKSNRKSKSVRLGRIQSAIEGVVSRGKFVSVSVIQMKKCLAMEFWLCAVLYHHHYLTIHSAIEDHGRRILTTINQQLCLDFG